MGLTVFCFFFSGWGGGESFHFGNANTLYEFIWLDVLIMFKHFSDDFRWICSVVSMGFCPLMEWWSYTVSDSQWYYTWRDKELYQGVYCSVLFIGYKALRDGSNCFKLPKFKKTESGHSGCFFLLHNILTPILSQMSHPFSSKMNLFHVDLFIICPNWYIMCLTQSDLHFFWGLDLEVMMIRHLSTETHRPWQFPDM